MSFNLTKRFELTVSTRPKFSVKIFISKYASACIYASLNIECGLHAHVPCVLASNVDYTLVLHKDTRNLCPPGDFSITFQLPGCLDDQQFNGDFTDGIFIGVVKKKVTRSIQLRQICLC
ncbi:hypothetical protein CICLE_v10003631mg [Citrus x clementina]|uniref:SHSP domain-containing protein n=1 Tax=Citrus clementina TaxID=85681 RepID=V4SFT5_CITCL|nr:hypothetical protein CICLE_v10003631mg [Citrus x clementina]